MKSMSSTRYKVFAGFTLLLAMIAFPIYAIKVYHKVDYTDFSVYYRAAVRAKNLQWNEIYNLKDGASPFRYAPPIVPLFRPFAELSSTPAHLLWYGLQFLWFSLGFYFIYLTLLSCQRRFVLVSDQNTSSSEYSRFLRMRALGITCLAALFIFRFCLDTFTIGQSSSLLFLGFCGALHAWVRRRRSHSKWLSWPSRMTFYLFVPALFKIGPGFLYGLFAAAKPSQRKQAIKTASVLTLGTALGTFLWAWIASGDRNLGITLWSKWAEIVAKDSVYYDASHYGSQSLKSFLLRSANWGWISQDLANQIYLTLALIICGGIASFWLLRRPRNLYGRALFFSLGLFSYFWVMPETFKYSLTPVAIPISLILLSPKKSLLAWVSLGFGALTLALAGKDLIGDPLFFGNQIYSLPLLSTLLMAGAVLQLAMKNSIPSRLANFWLRLFALSGEGSHKLTPWNRLPVSERNLKVSLLVPTPLLRWSSIDPKAFEHWLTECHSVLNQHAQGSFEILIVLYGDLLSEFHPIYQTVQKLQDPLNSKIHGSFKIVRHSDFPGRGAALRTGFLESRGVQILMGHPEQPCKPEFFTQALPLLKEGYQLVRANRRLEDTRFRIQVRLLPLVYGRHRLGLLFNRWVRLFLPIQTTDTHSGTLATTYKLAAQTFAVQTSPDFLFDLELNLTAAAQHARQKDLPVSLSLGDEKSFKRMLFETFGILFGVPLLAIRYHKGYYHLMKKPSGITSDDWGLSPGVNQGILKLAQLGVVKRVSMMANCPSLEVGLKELLAIPGLQVGIHFNLTYGFPSQTTPPQNSRLIEQQTLPNGYKKGGLISSPGKFLLHWLNPLSDRAGQRSFVQTELRAQLQKLRTLGIPIQYLDGHHHIHLVPGVVDTIAEILKTEGIRVVRLPFDRSLWMTSQAPLLLLSMLAKPRLRAYGFESPECLYPKRGYFYDLGKLRATLSQCPQAEVIVHPAEENDLETLSFPDTYTNERVLEFHALRMLSLES